MFAVISGIGGRTVGTRAPLSASARACLGLFPNVDLPVCSGAGFLRHVLIRRCVAGGAIDWRLAAARPREAGQPAPPGWRRVVQVLSSRRQSARGAAGRSARVNLPSPAGGGGRSRGSIRGGGAAASAAGLVRCRAGRRGVCYGCGQAICNRCRRSRPAAKRGSSCRESWVTSKRTPLGRSPGAQGPARMTYPFDLPDRRRGGG